MLIPPFAARVAIGPQRAETPKADAPFSVTWHPA